MAFARKPEKEDESSLSPAALRDWIKERTAGSAIMMLRDDTIKMTPDQVALRVKLSKALHYQYERSRHQLLLTDQIQLLEPVLRSADLLADGDCYPDAILQLGVAYRARFHASRDRSSIDRAVTLHESLLALLPSSSDSGCWMLYELGTTLRQRFEHYGDDCDLSHAYSFHCQSLDMCPSDLERRGEVLSGLATTLFWRFFRTGAIELLEQIISLNQQALDLYPPGHRDRPAAMCALGASLSACSHYTGNLQPLNNAVNLLEEAISLQGNEDATYINTLHSLAVALTNRSMHTGNLADVRRGIDMFYKTAAMTPKGSPFPPLIFSNPGFVIDYCLSTYASPDFLEVAIRLRREALVITPPEHVLYPVFQHLLILCLRTRFKYYGDLIDADEAIDLIPSLLQQSNETGPLHAQFLWAAATIYHDRFRNTDALLDLTEAIRLIRLCLSKVKKDDPRHHEWVAFYGENLNALHLNTGDEGALVSALQQYEISLELSPESQIFRPECLAALARTHIRCFMLWGNPQDMELAIANLTKALISVPSQHPLRLNILRDLASAHLTPGSPYYNRLTALEHLKMSLSETTFKTVSRVKGACELLEQLNAQCDPCDLTVDELRLTMDIYERIMELNPRIAFFGFDSRSCLRLIRYTVSLARDAAEYGLLLSRPDLAVEMLEQGRALFWTHYLRLRTKVDGLEPKLADELASVATQLRRGYTDLQLETRAAVQDFAIEQRLLGLKFEELAARVRTHPGYESFLRPSTFTALNSAAQNHPVLILIPGVQVSHALLLQGLEVAPVHIPLEGINASRLERLANCLRAVQRGERIRARGQRAVRIKGQMATSVTKNLLQDLWDGIMFPVIFAMGFQERSGDDRPRLHICATGIFAQLPVHAAGIIRENSIKGVSSYVVPSYTPTIGALLNARQHLKCIPTSKVRALLAAIPVGFQWKQLPHSREESRIIESIIPEHLILPIGGCPQSGVTSSQVLAKLPESSILHLACHGYQCPDEPLESGFVMSDSMLTVEQLMILDLPQSLFAFLSACETAKNDEKQPDQAIHLAATMLFAGFKSVIGTMWSMDDVDGPIVAKHVYEALFSGKSNYIDLEVVPRALDAALNELRSRGVRPTRWAPYVHLGI